MNEISIKRIYDALASDDDYRILIDRIWPRGVSKENARLDEWNTNVAPSEELREWFNHQVEKFGEFSLRYRKELKKADKDLEHILDIAKNRKVCLLYGAKNETFNQAVILQQVLIEKANEDSRSSISK